MPDDVFAALRDMTYGRLGFPLPDQSVPLHAMLAACGHENQTDRRYDWDGMQRGDADTALIQYTIAGHGMLDYEGRQFRVGPGQAMIIYYPFPNRYWLPDDAKHWQFIYVCLYGEDVMRLWKEAIRLAGPVISSSPNSRFVRLLADIVRRRIRGEHLTAFLSSALAYRLTMHLLEHCANPLPDAERPDFVVRAAGFCEQHYTETIGVEEIADASGYSRYHFSRQFKQATGMAPAEYVTNLRLQHAIDLLTDTDLAIKEIAGRVGFNGSNYFCRAFRKHTGISPGEYRHRSLFR